MPSITCFKDLMDSYEVTMSDLEILYNETERYLLQSGIAISICSKDEINALGTCMYEIRRRLTMENSRVITCKANRECIYVDADLEKIGGLCGRMFDIFHIGLGHLSQWDEESHWLFGIKNYAGAPTKVQEVYRYEVHAATTGIAELENLLRSISNDHLTEDTRENILNLFEAISIKDILYIVDVVKCGSYKVFFDGTWNFDFSLRKIHHNEQ